LIQYCNASPPLREKRRVRKQENKDQSNLEKGGIANLSFVFARLQHRTDGLAAICNCMFWLGFDPKSLLPWGQGRGSNTMWTAPRKCTCQMASKSVVPAEN